MMESLIDLVRYLSENYGINYLGGHKEFHNVLNSNMTDSGENRFCPGDRGMEIVEMLRSIFKFKSPSEMTPTDKNWYQ